MVSEVGLLRVPFRNGQRKEQQVGVEGWCNSIAVLGSWRLLFSWNGGCNANTRDAEERYYRGLRCAGSLSDFSGHLFGHVNFIVVPLIIISMS